MPSSGYDAKQVDFSSLVDPGNTCSEWHMSWKTTLWPQECSHCTTLYQLAFHMKISGKNQKKSQMHVLTQEMCDSNVQADVFHQHHWAGAQRKGSGRSSTAMRVSAALLWSLPPFATASLSALLGCCSFYVTTGCVACLIFSLTQRLGVGLFLTGIFKMFTLIDSGSSSWMTQDPLSRHLYYPDLVGESQKQLVTGWLDWNRVVWTGLMESETMLPNGTFSQ